jgi:hypothetical protein
MSGIKINITSHPNALNSSQIRSHYAQQPYSTLANNGTQTNISFLGSNAAGSGGAMSSNQFASGTRSDGSTWYSDYYNYSNPDLGGAGAGPISGMMYVFKTYTCPANMIFVGKAILSVSMVAGNVTLAGSNSVPHTGLAAAGDFIITKFHERDGSGTAIVQDSSTQYAELPIYLNAGESITLKVVGTTVFQASAYLCGTTTAA